MTPSTMLFFVWFGYLKTVKILLSKKKKKKKKIS